MKQPLENVMREIKEMGTSERHKREVACLDHGQHDMRVLGLAGGAVFTYCDSCLTLFVHNVAVNSTPAT
jgi:hypothetical protein